MSGRAPIAATESTMYREYERKRRLQLARTLLPIFTLVQFGVFVVSVVFFFGARFDTATRQVFAFNTMLVGVDAALHAAGWIFVRREQVTRAMLSVIVPVGITIMVPLLMYDIFDRTGVGAASPIVPITIGEMAATLILIVLSGVLATNRWILVGTTALMNVYTLFILSNALQIPGAGVALRSDGPLLLSFPLFVQWSVMGILFATSGTYTRTLRELGDVRIAYERAQQLDQLKDQFIAHVNHELRSPVMAVQGHVELLLLTHETLSSEERRTYLVRAKRAGDALVGLVTSILATRRLEEDASAFTPEPVALQEALASALQLIDPRDGNQVERDLRVRIPADLQVWAEPVRVRQILTNLLSNALKYSPPGTPVEVTAEMMQVSSATPLKRWQKQVDQPREMVDVSVRDYGLGIPPEQIPLLFKRFVRLPRDLASNVQGNGLGLYICRAYAEAMGGTLWIESTGIEGEGSVFHLQLPAFAHAETPIEVSV